MSNEAAFYLIDTNSAYRNFLKSELGYSMPSGQDSDDELQVIIV